MKRSPLSLYTFTPLPLCAKVLDVPAPAPIQESSLPSLTRLRQGKVRDVYAVDAERLLIVATDRISAFDCILPTPIERKGEVLTALSKFWFEKLQHVVANHLIESDVDAMPLPALVRLRGPHFAVLESRTAAGELVLLDPARGELVVSRRTFASWWTGETLLFAQTRSGAPGTPPGAPALLQGRMQ